jgi:hypothetical protein
MTIKEFYEYCKSNNLQDYTITAFGMNRHNLFIGWSSYLDENAIHPDHKDKSIELYFQDDSILSADTSENMNEYLSKSDSEIEFSYSKISNGISIAYVLLYKADCPKAIEDDYYILITFLNGTNSTTCRISLVEPKYIYDSKPLPVEYKSDIIKSIYNTYRNGIMAINEYQGSIIFDPDTDIPNYNLL